MFERSSALPIGKGPSSYPYRFQAHCKLMLPLSFACVSGYHVDRQHVTLREEDSSYTKEFIEMTKDIYLEELASDRNRMDIPHS